jgi:hypothetical protein
MYLCNIVVLDTPYIFGSILKGLLFKFTWICPWIHFNKETTITLKGLTFWPNLYTDFEKNDTLGPMEMRCHDLHHWTLKFTTSVKWHAQHSCVSGRFRKYRAASRATGALRTRPEHETFLFIHMIYFRVHLASYQFWGDFGSQGPREIRRCAVPATCLTLASMNGVSKTPRAIYDLPFPMSSKPERRALHGDLARGRRLALLPYLALNCVLLHVHAT